MDDQVCECEKGYTGQHCEACDEGAGYVSDGRGKCVSEPPPCREGVGAIGFAELLDDADDALGHAPSELDVVSAEISAVDGAAAGVRAWNYLWGERVEVVLSPREGVFLVVGSADVPPEQDGLSPIKVTVGLSRAELAAYPEFVDGTFAIGVRGTTVRSVGDRFHVDVTVELDVEAF